MLKVYTMRLRDLSLVAMPRLMRDRSNAGITGDGTRGRPEDAV